MLGERAADQLEEGGVVGDEGDGGRHGGLADAGVQAARADVGEEVGEGGRREVDGEEFSRDHVVGLVGEAVEDLIEAVGGDVGSWQSDHD